MMSKLSSDRSFVSSTNRITRTRATAVSPEKSPSVPGGVSPFRMLLLESYDSVFVYDGVSIGLENRT